MTERPSDEAAAVGTDMWLFIVGVTLAMAAGVVIGVWAVFDTGDRQLRACEAQERYRRCCSCTQAELGRCGGP